MEKFKDLLKPIGKLKISKIFINSKTNQLSITLPRKKLKCVPTKIELFYWGNKDGVLK
jgi:hypothetical protein